MLAAWTGRLCLPYRTVFALLAASGFDAANQAYLFEARQMQALSFAAHIPLVCFGIAFPALVVLAEALYLRTGDPLYRVLARRWSKVMLALFAVGAVTGTILSFELGLLWPAFMSSFGDVFGLAFAVEGVSFFVEAIFIGIYIYGWNRLSARAHLLTGIPIVISGFAGSLMVIAVNGWMNHPTGFTLKDGQAVDVHPFAALFENSYFWHELVHMYFAGYIVAGFVTASVYAWALLRGRNTRYTRTALILPLTVAAIAAPAQVVVGDWLRARSPPRSRPSWRLSKESARRRRVPPSTFSAGTTATRSSSGSRSRSCSRCSRSTTRTPPCKGSTRCPPTSVRRSTSCASPSRRWS